MKQPQNETETHFMLKEISKYLLFNMGYTRLATEVGSMWAMDFNDTSRNVIDAVGVKKVGKLIPNSGFKYHNYWSMCGMEAKASLSDFRNGFCTAPALTYVIAPSGIIPHDEIPPKIGLIEVDVPNVVIKKQVNKIDSINGVKIAVRARTRIDSRFNHDKEHYRKWCEEMLEQISYRTTSELLFWRNVIPLVK